MHHFKIIMEGIHVPPGETYFAVHDEHFTVAAIAEQIVRTFGRGRITHVEWPEERQRIEIEQVRISGARLRSITGWAPGVSLAEGLEKTRRVMEGQAPS